MIEIGPGIDPQPIAVREILYAVGQLLQIGHSDAPDEDWDDGNVLAQRRFDAQAGRP